ncbi:MAG: DNA polymerase III subunit chi [Rhodoferax sp.]|nr:DNA polymerase III subunit chi [Betaproteobacteria bacterium]NCN98307.1 DNA polymerase III subunit chi [Rhodoferax sp.]OIP17582.1 MAG: DNA polymerase III subunit chi [Comamonadaceae bacterium CG2_30_57_122]PIZ23270.1 MAG: DNA polymerase III subunit chi [Comamonadaceae bacterium CG_4_10_14_0_8_um_filter_57_29]PJC18269.1 MAG: DNA polymerase III subunit chi [Comamonadaceae bacterium CG_4_9_14_0_8_um_filter_57_21]
MTDIVFHFNATERLTYVCRLLRKAVMTSAQVVVTGSREQLCELDSALWTFSPIDFVPHCDSDADSNLVKKSPVILATSLQELPFSSILLNLSSSIPDGFKQFGRVIEVVSLDEAEKKQARARWKRYSDMGMNMMSHDVGVLCA